MKLQDLRSAFNALVLHYTLLCKNIERLQFIAHHGYGMIHYLELNVRHFGRQNWKF